MSGGGKKIIQPNTGWPNVNYEVYWIEEKNLDLIRVSKMKSYKSSIFTRFKWVFAT